MKVFVIGGVTVPRQDPSFQKLVDRLDGLAQRLGEEIVMHGHDLIACSPYDDAIDRGALKGAARAIRDKGISPTIELHCPKQDGIIADFEQLIENLSLQPNRHFYEVPLDKDGKLIGSYGWLLPQILAMDGSDAIIGLGGRQSGAATLLLSIAQSRRKPVLPFTFFGGATEKAFHARRFELESQFGNELNILHKEEKIGRAVAVLTALAAKGAPNFIQGPERRFFISYPKARPQEADLIEMTLRRRHYEVFRDRYDNSSGQPTQTEIEEQIYRANIFIVVWCKEYACSPWCYDELKIALETRKMGASNVWIFQVDETRIVPPAARHLIPYPAKTRDQLEEQLIKLLAHAGSLSTL